jgi:hypothetical protein
MSTEPCPQCGAQWQAGQEVCPNCGYRRPPVEARFRTGDTGIRPMPSMPSQEQGPGQPGPPSPPGPPPPPSAPSPGQYAGPGAAGAPPAPGAQGAPGAWGAAPAPTARWEGGTAPRRRSALRPLAIIGALGVIAAGPLPWNQFHFEASGWNLLLKFLFTGNRLDFFHDPTDPSFNIASIGVVLIVLGAIALVLSFVPSAHVIRRLAGLLAAAIVVGFVVQLMVGEVNESVGNLFKDLGPGAYTGFVGGILVLVG